MSDDLLELHHLEAEFEEDSIIHSVYTGSFRGKRTERWQQLAHLGSGGAGVVRSEREVESGKMRALKVIYKPLLEGIIDCKRELVAMGVLSKYRHAFVEFQGWFEYSDHLYVAMEYFPLGDMGKYLSTVPAGRLPEQKAKVIAGQIFGALEYMHRHKFTHRDLKPDNIFVCSSIPFWIKLGDFGISKRASKTSRTELRTRAYTFAYAAPEVSLSSNSISTYTSKVDIWSSGCILFRVLVGVTPFLEPMELYRYCATGEGSGLKAMLREVGTSEKGTGFVVGLLKPEAEERPSVKECVKDAWVDGWEELEPAAVLPGTAISRETETHPSNERNDTNAGAQTEPSTQAEQSESESLSFPESTSPSVPPSEPLPIPTTASLPPLSNASQSDISYLESDFVQHPFSYSELSVSAESSLPTSPSASQSDVSSAKSASYSSKHLGAEEESDTKESQHVTVTTDTQVSMVFLYDEFTDLATQYPVQQIQANDQPTEEGSGVKKDPQEAEEQQQDDTEKPQKVKVEESDDEERKENQAALMHEKDDRRSMPRKPKGEEAKRQRKDDADKSEEVKIEEVDDEKQKKKQATATPEKRDKKPTQRKPKEEEPKRQRNDDADNREEMKVEKSDDKGRKKKLAPPTHEKDDRKLMPRKPKGEEPKRQRKDDADKPEKVKVEEIDEEKQKKKQAAPTPEKDDRKPKQRKPKEEEPKEKEPKEQRKDDAEKPEEVKTEESDDKERKKKQATPTPEKRDKKPTQRKPKEEEPKRQRNITRAKPRIPVVKVPYRPFVEAAIDCPVSAEKIEVVEGHHAFSDPTAPTRLRDEKRPKARSEKEKRTEMHREVGRAVSTASSHGLAHVGVHYSPRAVNTPPHGAVNAPDNRREEPEVIEVIECESADTPRRRVNKNKTGVSKSV